MAPASGTGSGRSNTEFTTAKVAVFAAIQTAIVRTTVTVNPLSPTSERTACLRLRKAEPIMANTLSGRAFVARNLAYFAAGPIPPCAGARCSRWENTGMPVIEIRDASDGDLPGILRVLAESGIEGGISFTVEEARAHLDRIRSRSNFRLLAAIVDGEIA